MAKQPTRTRSTTTKRTKRKKSAGQPAKPIVVTTGVGNVRLVESTKTAKRRASKPKVAVLLDADELVRRPVGGFSNFLKEYAVVGLALGFIVGQQANGVVKQFVDSFVNPLFAFLFGQKLSTRVAIAHHQKDTVTFPWGAFVYVLLEFFFVLISIYVVIKVFKLDRYAKKKIEEVKDAKK